MRTITIEKNDAGQRIDKFLTKTFRELPTSMMYKYIRQKDIKINGKRCEASTRLSEGDVIALYVKDEFLTRQEAVYDFLRASKRLDVIYEDDHVMLLNKPVGLLCHPDKNEYGDTLLFRAQRYLYEKGAYDPSAENSFAPALVNRIDRNTAGIVIVAKTAAALRILNQKLKDREIRKFYLCVVHGVPNPEHALLKGFLLKDEERNLVTVSDRPMPNGRTILTEYRVLEAKNGLALVEIELHTGRTHQIRAHMASIGHPLLGDGKYGTNALNKGTGFHKQALCSYKLQFAFTTPADELEYLNGQAFQLPRVPFAEDFRAGKIGG
ncbi:MAG: RluA family pseudouridine synthase [Acutalibacteraceae bacterium]|jgi:23S rRNA pseudouridine955/2504/2580 synthase